MDLDNLKNLEARLARVKPEVYNRAKLVVDILGAPTPEWEWTDEVTVLALAGSILAKKYNKNATELGKTMAWAIAACPIDLITKDPAFTEQVKGH